MKLKKIVVVILCFAMIGVLLAGCDNTQPWFNENDQPEDDPSSTDSLDQDPSSSDNSSSPDDSDYYLLEEIDFEAAFAAFPPGTIMINAGEYIVTWEELYFNIRGALTYMASMYGFLPNLSEITSDGGTYADTMMSYAVDNALMFRGLEHGASISGISFSESDYDAMMIDLETLIELYGGEEPFLDLLWEYDGIRNFELFKYLFIVGNLSSITFEAMYGEEGSQLTDEEVAELTVYGGFLMAKHILRLKTEDGDDTPLRETEEIFNQLSTYSGDDLGAFFDELMFEHSEDGGLEMFPGGYLFQAGDMVSAFYDAAVALEIGDFSEIVETEYGYHILFRIPIDYNAIPSAYSRVNDMRSLRSITAMELFDSKIYGWIDQLNVTFTAEFDLVDIAALFRKA